MANHGDEPAYDPAFRKHLIAKRRDVERDNATCPHLVMANGRREIVLPANLCPFCWKRWAAYHERCAAVVTGMLETLRRELEESRP